MHFTREIIISSFLVCFKKKKKRADEKLVLPNCAFLNMVVHCFSRIKFRALSYIPSHIHATCESISMTVYIVRTRFFAKYFFSIILISVFLGIQPRILSMLTMNSTAKLHQSYNPFQNLALFCLQITMLTNLHERFRN